MYVKGVVSGVDNCAGNSL